MATPFVSPILSARAERIADRIIREGNRARREGRESRWDANYYRLADAAQRKYPSPPDTVPSWVALGSLD